MIEFTIPGRPSAWQRTNAFIDKRSGKLLKSTPKEMAAAQKAVATLCRFAMRTMPPLAGALRLEILCVYAIPPSWPKWKRQAAIDGKVWKVTVPDHDNLVKLISDALNGIAYADDGQIVKSSFGKRYGSPERTEVRITALDVLCDHSARGAFSEAAAERVGQGSLLSPSGKASNTQTEGGSRRGGVA
jgi:Holliday junction resolvase RusA-like endonuclease